MYKNTLILGIVTLFFLVVTGITIIFDGQLLWVHYVRIIFGSIVVLIIPGYWITRWTFPLKADENILDPLDEKLEPKEETPKTIDGLERFVLSVALSISAVPLLLFYVNFLGVPLTIWSVFWTIAGVTAISFGCTVFIEQRHAKHA